MATDLKNFGEIFVWAAYLKDARNADKNLVESPIDGKVDESLIKTYAGHRKRLGKELLSQAFLPILSNICKQATAHRIYFLSRETTSSRLIGFEVWAFMPLSKHRLMSSGNASAVMAIIGMVCASGRFKARIFSVAS